MKNKSLMTRVPAAHDPWTQILKVLNKGSKESWHAIYDGKDLMVKMDKLVQKIENRFFGMASLKKWLNK
jgi:hypothetical protein